MRYTHSQRMTERHLIRDVELCGRHGSRSASMDDWINSKTIHAWRLRRLLSALDPLLDLYPSARWLTVGDSIFGSEAHYIMARGIEVTATNITDQVFHEAARRGYIGSFSQQNAEALTFDDNAFDYVLCKEAYHHFSRPPVALYEMLRVVRQGVVLMEPQDRYIIDHATERILNNRVFYWLLRKAGFNEQRYDFEPTGNYVFSISRREMEKIALTAGCRGLAFRGMNDFPSAAEIDQKADHKNPHFQRMRILFFLHDLAAKLRIIKHRKLCAMIFKKTPKAETCSRLEQIGFDIVMLPANPYLHTERHSIEGTTEHNNPLH